MRTREETEEYRRIVETKDYTEPKPCPKCGAEMRNAEGPRALLGVPYDHNRCPNCGKELEREWRLKVQDMYFVKHERIGLIHKVSGIDYGTLFGMLGFATWDEYFKHRHKQLQAERSRSGWDAARRKHIKDNNECVLCGSEKWLTVHHINRDRLDHTPHNLVSLCRRCHSRVHSHGRTTIRDPWKVRFVAWLRRHGYRDATVLTCGSLTPGDHHIFKVDGGRDIGLGVSVADDRMRMTANNDEAVHFKIVPDVVEEQVR